MLNQALKTSPSPILNSRSSQGQSTNSLRPKQPPTELQHKTLQKKTFKFQLFSKTKMALSQKSQKIDHKLIGPLLRKAYQMKPKELDTMTKASRESDFGLQLNSKMVENQNLNTCCSKTHFWTVAHQDIKRKCSQKETLKTQSQNSFISTQSSQQRSQVWQSKSTKVDQDNPELPLQSRVSPFVATHQKISKHLQALDTLFWFVKENQNKTEWQQLSYFILKKYFQERTNIANFLNKYPMNNPFRIRGLEISSMEIVQFTKTYKCELLKLRISEENNTIKSLIDQKDTKNFSLSFSANEAVTEWIVHELWAKTILTQFSADYSSSQIYVICCKQLQLLFLIQELKGNYMMSFFRCQRSLRNGEEKNYIDQSKQLFEKKYLFKR